MCININSQGEKKELDKMPIQLVFGMRSFIATCSSWYALFYSYMYIFEHVYTIVEGIFDSVNSEKDKQEEREKQKCQRAGVGKFIS